MLPVAATGKSDVLITLVDIDGSVLAEARTTLVVYARPVDARTPPSAPDQPSGAVKSDTSVDYERALGFIKRGEELMATGNVEGARLFYERAANAGLPQGALALAATFDPYELGRRQVVGGLRPDPAQARRWYERARELGAAEADEPLRRLSAYR
jgi:TPR repeat protein